MTVSTAVDASAVARVTGIKTTFKNLRKGGILYLPQRIAVIGQGSTASTYSTTKAQVTSALDVANTYGFGSPLHLACLQLLPVNGDGVGTIPVTVYPLDDDVSGVAATGDITPIGAVTKAGEFRVLINNIQSAAFTVAIGDVVADITDAITTAINAELNEPMIAADATTKVNLTSKWKGASANDLYVEIDGPTDTGVSFAITQPSGGLVNPSISAALAQVGDIWETMFLNCFEVADTTTLGLYSTFGEGRWGALVRKPMVSFVGNNDTTVAAATAVSDARTTDRVNCVLVEPAGNDLPCVIAGRQLARIAVVANNNPAHDYGSQRATGLVPGADGSQWTYAERDQAVKAGCSTIEVRNNEVTIGDVVTMYHPAGDPLPAYRHVVDIVKLMNVIFNTDLIYNTAEWDGAPLIPDDQPTTNRDAKKPKTATAATAAMIDSLGREAIISDPETAKASIVSEIDGSNPKRLNQNFTVQVSGNTNIKSIDLDFGFYFGTSAIVG